jgi:hypothetical protein
MQLLGKALDEPRILQIAHEQTTDWHKTRSPIAKMQNPNSKLQN